MDPAGAQLTSDLHSPSHRQSILGSFLRVRPRGTSQSHQPLPNLQLEHSITNEQPLSDHPLAANTRGGVPGGEPPVQPPSPNPGGLPAGAAQGHRRRPAATPGGIQPTISAATHGFGIIPQSTATVSVHGLSQMLRRRRSANGALNSNSAGANSPVDAHTPPSSNAMSPAPTGVTGRPPQVVTGPPPPGNTNSNARTHRIRLVPHLDSSRSLHFEPISRDVREGDAALRIGRFTDRSGLGVAALNAQNTNKLAFKSKVVSRAHAEVWCESGGKFYIKDTKSSSGTFLNHIRLSAPNTDSKPFPIKDGDVLQLGVDYQGGTEEIYKCVKMRVELGREWQSQPNAFNTNALKQLKALSGQPIDKPVSACKGSLSKSGISDCCICLFAVTVHQSLFIAPCSHVFHYKCIRPMLLMHHPGFSCPLCRTFANLEEDVEIDLDEQEAGLAGEMDSGSDGAGGGASGVEGQAPPVPPPSAASNTSVRDAMDVDVPANEMSAQAHAAGAETEVERDFAPPNMRRRNANNNTLHSRYEHSVSPAPEEADEYVSAGSDDLQDHHDHEQFHSQSSEEHISVVDETDDLHPLPALPAPTPSGAVPVPASPTTSSNLHSTSVSAPSQIQGFSIQRPMSVPISSLTSNNQFRSMALDEGSEGEGDVEDDIPIGRGMHAARVGMTIGGDGNASGSSGEGLGGVGMVGTGDKRKR